MKRIFLSFSFRDADRLLNSQIEQLVASHNLTTVTGERAGGQPLRDRIFRQIQKCDGLVALLTRREALADTGAGVTWTTSEWVKEELNHGRANQLKNIALVENGVNIEGAFIDHERIHFSRENLSEALLSLSATLGLWKSEAGRTLKLTISSHELLQSPRFLTSRMQIEYRYLIEGETTAWQPASLIRETGSAVVFLPGVQDNYLVQLGVRDGPNEWESDFVPQTIAIELHSISGGA